jgi:hypothetical protein
MGLLDKLRTRGWQAIADRDGRLATAARKVNDTLGRPLAPEDELADRRAFEQGYAAPANGGSAAASAPATPAKPVEAAPVIVYYFKEKQWRDAGKLTEILDANAIPYRVVNLDGDEATQAAVRRDAKGRGGPLCFVAGACIGGRAELTNLASTGELKKLVYGG